MLLFQIFYIIFRQTEMNEYFIANNMENDLIFVLYSKLLWCLSCWTLLNEKRKHVHQSMIVNKYSLTIVPFFNIMCSSSEFGTVNLVEPLLVFCQDLSYDNIHIKPYYTVCTKMRKPRCSNGHVNKIPNKKNSPAS